MCNLKINHVLSLIMSTKKFRHIIMFILYLLNKKECKCKKDEVMGKNVSMYPNV